MSLQEGPANRQQQQPLGNQELWPCIFHLVYEKNMLWEEDKLSSKKADGQIGKRPANKTHTQENGERAHNSNQSSKQLGVIITNGLDAARTGSVCYSLSFRQYCSRAAKRVEEGKSNFQN